VLGGVLVGALAAGLGSPSSLFGSPPLEVSWSAPASAVRVVDGETLRLGERVVRLHGLAAPERGARCGGARGEAFDCGAAAAGHLAALVAGQPLLCRLRGRDGFQRALAVCEAAGREVNGALVAAGYALADGSGDPALAAREAAAWTARAGLWAEGAAPPDWRERH